MATDLQQNEVEGGVVATRPGLKITGLHIRGLKSIQSLDLPADGMGWNGVFPDFVTIGGINGSGKTTILEFFVSSFIWMSDGSAHAREFESLPPELRAAEARLDFNFVTESRGATPLRFLIGSESFVRDNTDTGSYGLQHFAGEATDKVKIRVRSNQDIRYFESEFSGDFNFNFLLPSVVHFPSERRGLVSPETTYKFAGKLVEKFPFVQRWQPPNEWSDSLEARIYGIRYEDMSAKEEGRPGEANGFASYALAFDRFFEGRKKLTWRQGELIVETPGGAVHALSELSSGEKQVILFAGELLHRWRPGSLILIDEPELHLHEYFQVQLLTMLRDWQKERGGQVILATQSDTIFGASGGGTRVVLEGWAPR